MKRYNKEQVLEASIEYFNGDKLAANAFLKYALRKVNDKGEDIFYELTPEDMHRRMAWEFARIENKYPSESKLTEEEIFELFDGFKKHCPQGSPMMGIGNNHQMLSLGNCFVVDAPKDNMSDIVETGKRTANLYKRRAGVGLCVSNLRPDGAKVDNAALKSSGAWSFCDFFSYITGLVGQNNRRGAEMLTMFVNHPDIFKFVEMKSDLGKVTNANVSVKIMNHFMEMVEKDGQYLLQWPVDVPPEQAQYKETIKARKLWKHIVDKATKYAEPGLLFWDKICDYMPSHSYGKKYKNFLTQCVNPCGEIAMGTDSCRLYSQNLKHYVIHPFTNNAFFDFDQFRQDVRKAMRLSDDMVDLEIEKLNKLIDSADTEDERQMWREYCETAIQGRRTGLGTHGLADALARMCLRYDSEESINLIEQIYCTMKVEAYRESINLAKERGSFPIFDWEIEKDNDFIQSLPEDIKKDIATYGRRNISILTNAPTGTVSLLSQVSSGIEPVFRNSYVRRVKFNPHDYANSVTPDYTDDNGVSYKEFVVFHHNVEEYMKTFGTKEIPDFFVTSDIIDWEKRIDVQAAIQRHMDHSISSTINLPEGTKNSVVANLYMRAWKKGLKGVTVYVDGSRSGILVNQSTTSEDSFDYCDAHKRPKILDCDIHHSRSGWIFFVGLIDGKPYEIFGGPREDVPVSFHTSKGRIMKRPNVSYRQTSSYDLFFMRGKKEVKIKNINQAFNNHSYVDYTRLVSLSLRHGAKPGFIADSLLKNRESEMFSFQKCISRILRKYVENGERSGIMCQECNEKTMVYEGGCSVCMSCGNSLCG